MLSKPLTRGSAKFERGLPGKLDVVCSGEDGLSETNAPYAALKATNNSGIRIVGSNSRPRQIVHCISSTSKPLNQGGCGLC
eukprot:500239-Pelagomonas_calceolata.AAC.1